MLQSIRWKRYEYNTTKGDCQAAVLKVSGTYLLNGEDAPREPILAFPKVRLSIELSRLTRRVRELEEDSTEEINVLGYIPAGKPFPVEQIDFEPIRLQISQLGGVQVQNCFALKVSGESLSGDDIHDGDYLVVDKAPEYIDGFIYVVKLGSDLVARHAYWIKNMLRLRSTNGDYEDIQVAQAEIQGRVIASYRLQRFNHPLPLKGG